MPSDCVLRHTHQHRCDDCTETGVPLCWGGCACSASPAVASSQSASLRTRALSTLRLRSTTSAHTLSTNLADATLPASTALGQVSATLPSSSATESAAQPTTFAALSSTPARVPRDLHHHAATTTFTAAAAHLLTGAMDGASVADARPSSGASFSGGGSVFGRLRAATTPACSGRRSSASGGGGVATGATSAAHQTHTRGVELAVGRDRERV